MTSGRTEPHGEAGPAARQGVAEASIVVAILLLVLRLAGVAPLVSFVLADTAGVAVAVLACRRRGGEEPAVDMAVVLTLGYSLLLAVLVAFVLALVGAG